MDVRLTWKDCDEMQTDVVDKLLYADDLAENAKSEEKMQGAVDSTNVWEHHKRQINSLVKVLMCLNSF